MGSLGLSSGTISVVSRFVGAGEHDRADLAIKQSFWLALSITIPLTLVTYFEAEAMVGLLTDAPRTIALGGTYLRIVMLSVSFRFWSMIAARALQGAGDTRWPLYGTILGGYVYRLPVAFLALPVGFAVTVPLVGVTLAPGLGWGLPAIYAAIVGDFYLKAAVNTGRFWSGKWRDVARASGVGAGGD